MKNKDIEAVILVIAIAICSYAYSCLINEKLFFGIDLANIKTTNSANNFQTNYQNKNNKRSANYLENTLYEEINDYRVSKGLNKLKLDSRINEIAKKHSVAMAEQKIVLTTVDIKDSSVLIEDFMPYRSIGQAISYNFGHYNPARTTADSWISDPRFINTLQGEYEYTGIGVARSIKGEYYFTQIFVNPI